MKQIAVFVLCIIAGKLLHAQSVEEVLKRFPGEHAVIMNMNKEVRIFMKNNEPVAEVKEETEILALDDKANGIYNKYKIYHGSFNELKEMEAYTNVPDGNGYRKIKVVNVKTQSARSGSVFYDDTKETAFDFPSMVQGASGVVKYMEFLKDAHMLTPFYFTSYMPVVNARFTITFPQNIQLNYIIKNDNDKAVQFKQDKKGRQTVYEFTATNQKNKDRFGDAPTRSYYEPHIIYHILSYKNDDDKQVNFLGNVDDLFKWNAGFLRDINVQPSPVLKHLADSLTAGVATDKEKARMIYRWVQEHIKYVAFEDGLGGFIPRQAADVCTKRYGDCKDMSSLLTALLQTAGLKGYFTWIGTRDIPYDYSEVPLPITDNHMISTVNIGDEWIFLDGTDPNCIFGAPPQGIQGKQALIAIDAEKYKLIRVPEIPLTKNYRVDSTVISITDKGIKGSTSAYYNGYFGADAFNNLLYRDSKETKEFVKESLQKGSNKFILNEFAVNKLNPAEKVVNIKTSFEVPDYSKKIGDEMYINLNLDNMRSNVIDTAKRKIAVDNNFRFKVKNYTILEVPEGYTVEYLPENHSFKNDLYGFSIDYKQLEGKVVSSFEFTSDCMLMQPSQFNKWNETIKELATQTKKQLVLKKK
jgi:hypothetical protein